MTNTILSLALFAVFLHSAISFDLNRKDNVVVYWGQNGVGSSYPNDRTKWEKNLNAYCNDSTYDVVIIGFLNTFFDSRTTFNGSPLPLLNLAFHCETTFSSYPYLISCPSIAADIQYCQSKGKAVMLSLGGAAGVYGFSSSAQAKTFATTVWNMFLGGSVSGMPRPFGSAIMDGVDLDIEGGALGYYGDFVNAIKPLMNADSSKKYYVSGAPQCPMPDAYLGPSSNSALSTSPFDFINIQFYNNYCGINSPANFNYAAWASWAQTSTYNQKMKIMVGAPASSMAAGSGYITPSALQSIINSVKSDSSFAGVMFWDAGNVDINTNACGTQNYGQCIAAFLKNGTTVTIPSTTAAKSTTAAAATTAAKSTTAARATTAAAATTATRATTAAAATTASATTAAAGGTGTSNQQCCCYSGVQSVGHSQVIEGQTAAPGKNTEYSSAELAIVALSIVGFVCIVIIAVGVVILISRTQKLKHIDSLEHTATNMALEKRVVELEMKLHSESGN